MPDDAKSLLKRVCDLVGERIDPGRIALARRRHGAVMAGREADSIPLICSAPAPEAEGLPSFSWGRRFGDPDASLYMQLKELVLPRVGIDTDCVPGVRADLGTVICQSVLGAQVHVQEDQRTCIGRYASKEALAELEPPDDVAGLGVVPRMVEHMQHHIATLRRHGLGGVVGVHHCDQQGPFDIAAMARGHDIFTDMYEDEPFVHDLMRKATAVFVSVSKLCKKLSGEPLDSGNAAGIWMDRGGVRMCGDSDILVSAEMYRRFIQPCQRQALEAFGGGWLHYCGGWEGTGRTEGLHLHEAYAEIEALRGLNWSTARDWLGEMRRLRSLGLVHIGGVPRLRGETLEDYFRRALSPYERRSGMIFGGTWEGPSLRDGEHERAMETWRRVQDEKFGP